MEKSCYNCHSYDKVRSCWEGDCKVCDSWKPTYKDLQSQLTAANSLITEQIEQIAELREALQEIADFKVCSITELMAIAKQALSGKKEDNNG